MVIRVPSCPDLPHSPAVPCLACTATTSPAQSEYWGNGVITHRVSPWCDPGRRPYSLPSCGCRAYICCFFPSSRGPRRCLGSSHPLAIRHIPAIVIHGAPHMQVLSSISYIINLACPAAVPQSLHTHDAQFDVRLGRWAARRECEALGPTFSNRPRMLKMKEESTSFFLAVQCVLTLNLPQDTPCRLACSIPLYCAPGVDSLCISGQESRGDDPHKRTYRSTSYTVSPSSFPSVSCIDRGFPLCSCISSWPAPSSNAVFASSKCDAWFLSQMLTSVLDTSICSSRTHSGPRMVTTIR